MGSFVCESDVYKKRRQIRQQYNERFTPKQIIQSYPLLHKPTNQPNIFFMNNNSLEIHKGTPVTDTTTVHGFLVELGRFAGIILFLLFVAVNHITAVQLVQVSHPQGGCASGK